jgi:hypothetical protein
MEEMQDYSGPFVQGVTLHHFSKQFLLKLIRVWQRAWLQLDAAWFDEVENRFGQGPAYECDLEMWTSVADHCNRRYAKIAKIEPRNVIDSLKVLQLPIDNSMGEYPCVYDIINENHAINTITQCPSLEWCEREAPGRIEPMCRVLELKVMSRYVANPWIRITPLKMPPRDSTEEVPCRWEFYRWVPEGTTVREADGLVDERKTEDIPELDDLSGPFYPNLRHENFSKEFLIKLMNAWQYGWLRMGSSYYEAASKRFGPEVANDINRRAWIRVAERTIHRYARVANIQLNTVLDSLKVLQISLNSTIGPLFKVKYDIKNENHVLLNVTECRALSYYERQAPDMIEPVCHVLERESFKKHLGNPKIEVVPLRLPPRKRKNQIACQWELRYQ